VSGSESPRLRIERFPMSEDGIKIGEGVQVYQLGENGLGGRSDLPKFKTSIRFTEVTIVTKLERYR